MNAGNEKRSNPINRKQFLRAAGTIAAGAALAAVSVKLLNRTPSKADIPVPPSEPASGKMVTEGTTKFASPYRLIQVIEEGKVIQGLETFNDKLYVITEKFLAIYNVSGALLSHFPIAGELRDIAVDGDEIFLLFDTRIEVFNHTGKKLRDWQACSDQSDYLSIALAPEAVFVSDVSNKNICKYSRAGEFKKFIQSPVGFIIPSYSFGMVIIDKVLYCSNSGRHLVESYTLDGDYISSFGQPGGGAGRFVGCCNPVHLTNTAWGDIITSEKGIPRISCYSRDGKFRNILLNSDMIGGGNTAREVKTVDDKIFVAGNKGVLVFQFDSALHDLSGCAGCSADCPLRKNTKQ